MWPPPVFASVERCGGTDAPSVAAFLAAPNRVAWPRRPAHPPAMIRLLIADDHPAVRTGLVSAFRLEPGLVPVAATATAHDALAIAERETPDVAILDYELPDRDGLLLCRKVKALSRAPRVLVYSAFAGPVLALRAIVAGADGLVNKGAATADLLDAIRVVARGGRAMPSIPLAVLRAGAAKLASEELPVLGMALDRTPEEEMGAVLGIDRHEVCVRLGSIVAKLSTDERTER